MQATSYSNIVIEWSDHHCKQSTDFLGQNFRGQLVNYHYNIFTANIGSAFLRQISIVYKAITRGVLWIPSDGNDERSLGGFW